jgi:hypothetical protein
MTDLNSQRVHGYIVNVGHDGGLPEWAVHVSTLRRIGLDVLSICQITDGGDTGRSVPEDGLRGPASRLGAIGFVVVFERIFAGMCEGQAQSGRKDRKRLHFELMGLELMLPSKVEASYLSRIGLPLSSFTPAEGNFLETVPRHYNMAIQEPGTPSTDNRYRQPKSA